jgi:hypothetical protein
VCPSEAPVKSFNVVAIDHPGMSFNANAEESIEVDFERTIELRNPEAKIYVREEYMTLSHDQRRTIDGLKADAGWQEATTPPPGHIIDSNGYAVVSNSMVSAIRSMIGATNTQIPLPPVPVVGTPAMQPPAVIITDPRMAGASFGQRGTSQRADDTSAISVISANGRTYNVTGAIYDQNHNRLN